MAYPPTLDRVWWDNAGAGPKAPYGMRVLGLGSVESMTVDGGKARDTRV